MSESELQILHRSDDVIPFLDIVRQRADSERNALGFLPRRAYESTALKGDLFVAMIDADKSPNYAGHLIAGGLSPTCRVFQVYVDPKFRNRGIATSLLNNLTRRATSRYDLCIRADVAADLVDANRFWVRSGFSISRTIEGGKSRNRKINIYVRDLETPCLFSASRNQSAESPSNNPGIGFSPKTPQYLLDLNVLFDVVKKRTRKAESSTIINASLRNIIDVAVAPETIAELERNTIPDKSDTAMSFALSLPQVHIRDEANLVVLEQDIAGIVFREKAIGNNLSSQDKSDVKHLATTILSGSCGFVTSEKALLRASDEIRSKYGIDIISVENLSALLVTSPVTTHYKKTAEVQGMPIQVNLLKTESSLNKAESFMDSLHVPHGFKSRILGGQKIPLNSTTMEVSVRDRMIVVASWEDAPSLNIPLKLTIISDEDHPLANIAIQKILDKVVTDACRERPALLELDQVPGQALCRKIAFHRGFRAPPNSERSDSPLVKIAVGKPLTHANWYSLRTQIQALGGLLLPGAIPQDTDHTCDIVINNNFLKTTPLQLEDLLSPTIIASPNRHGLIVPIRKTYAKRLLETGRQLPLLPNPEATFHFTKAFFSSPKNKNIHKAGSIIAFYESKKDGGQGAVVALARMLYSNIIVKREADYDILRLGVITKDSLDSISVGESILMTTFDNLIPLESPISLQRLRKLGCDDGTSFVCSKAIMPDQMIAIIEEGVLHA